MIHTNDEAEKIINSIGCLAELLSVFYNSLHRGGLSEAQSFSLFFVAFIRGHAGYDTDTRRAGDGGAGVRKRCARGREDAPPRADGRQNAFPWL